MKKILFTLSVSCFSIAYAQNLNFADPKFKTLILSSNSSNEIAKDLSGNSIVIDANGDGEIQVSEAQQVVILNVKMDETQKYDAVTGDINFPYYFNHLPGNISDALLFTNIEELYISDTKSANISFVNNSKIKKLICENRWFYDEGSFNGNFYESFFFPVDLTIDNCPSILTMNDISASYHPYFLGQAIFRIKNNPQFNGALILNDRLVSELYFENINLTSININDCRGLVKLSVPNIATLQTLNITNTQDSQNSDQEINLIANNCNALQELVLDGDYYDSRAVYLSAINVNGCTSLKKIKGLNAPNIDLSTAGLINLEELDCSFYNRYIYNTTGGVYYGKLNSLNLSGLPNLKILKASNQPITNNINFSAASNLENIDVTNSSGYMTTMDLSTLSSLQTLNADRVYINSNYGNNDLTSVNIKNGSLEQIVGFENHNYNLSVCVDDAQLAGLQAQYPGINFSSNCNSLFTTIWDGTSWSNGAPNAKDVIITGAYTTSATTPAFTAKNITIKNGGVLEITSGNTISGMNVTVEDGGNLIQKDGSALSYTGAFKALKNGTSAVDKYTFWTSPVVGQTLANIYTGATPSSITEYNTPTDSYINTTSTVSVFGKAYSIKTPVANAALAFEGTPNNGTQTFTLATSGNGFNLVGNPYPSSLSLGAFYTENSARISSTFYFWDNKSTSVTLQNGATTTNYGYATFNAANGANPTWVPAPNGNGGTAVVPVGTVANIGQGFIVKTLNTSVDTSLIFNNEMRGTTNATFFNKDNSSTEGKFWLKLNSDYNTNNTFAVDYINGASDSFDNYDSKAIGMGSDGFYTLADAQKLIIQGKESFDIHDIVPVGVKHFQNGNFTIALVQKEGLFNNGQAIYLHDKVTGTYTDLQSGNYTFTANTGESTNRFEIVYKLSVLATAEAKKDSFEVYRDGQDFVVRNNENIKKVEIFDAAGRKIQTINESAKLVRVHLTAKGVYILKALSDGKEYTKKIIN
ncbi:T9SS type A sorting domain-containing protein [Chryseobacterium sp. LC2016-27]|uniref:T9SS type A sorting domain-containing protein n=1 Tax=Chryseobacterium sp. LC2016-27 TaxID=2897326 RepID=UPI001E4C383C|nr:T9SS type A sorting domain-containing protein [Chryseobacterium sp. LC2016-27]MCD0457576.1 T9SS type A sorting domain-containing protein [Chryseobacterium sp. LC2016-27]